MTDQAKSPSQAQHEHSMRKLVLRWALPTSALLLFGPIAAWPVAQLRDSTGGTETTLLLSNAPVLGVLGLALLTGIAAIGGGVTARLTAAGTGRTFAGLCIVWTAMRTGNSWDIFMVRGGGAVVPLAIEGALVAVAGLVLLAALLIIGGGKTPAQAAGELLSTVRGKAAPIGILAGVVGGVIGSMLVGLDGLRGQCLLAGIGGGVLAAVAVQMSAPELSPEQARLRASVVTLLLAVVGPLTMLAVPGGGEIAAAARAGTLTGPGIVQPLDWLAGVFLGVPTGMAWVGSVSERAAAGAAKGPTPKRATKRA